MPPNATPRRPERPDRRTKDMRAENAFQRSPVSPRLSASLRAPALHFQRAVALLSLLIAHPLRANEPGYRQVTQPRAWSFPRDHGRHDGYKTEWWYFTGHLREKSTGRRFGYQLTFFRSAMTPAPATRPSPWAMTDLYFAHAALSDLASRQFHFKDRLQRGRPGLAGSSAQTMDVSLLDWSARLDQQGIVHLRASEPSFSIDLTCSPGR